MRLATLCLLLAALSWPALARQDQSQAPAPQNPPASQAPAQNASTQAPAQTPTTQAPAQPSTPAGTQQAPETEAPPSSVEAPGREAAGKTTSKQKKTAKKHKKAKAKKPPGTAADTGPRRVVIRRGGTSETGGQLEPGTPESQADHQRQSTERLLQSTDANLKNISKRKLTSDQQDMVRQITFYMEQSRSANKEGDLGRARNLAVKAHMLSDALARQ